MVYLPDTDRQDVELICGQDFRRLDPTPDTRGQIEI